MQPQKNPSRKARVFVSYLVFEPRAIANPWNRQHIRVNCMNCSDKLLPYPISMLNFQKLPISLYPFSALSFLPYLISMVELSGLHYRLSKQSVVGKSLQMGLVLASFMFLAAMNQ